MNGNAVSLLFISQDQQNREFVDISLKKFFKRIVFAQSPVEASLKITNEKFKVLLIDFRCIQEQHSKFVGNIAASNPKLHIIILSDQNRPDISDYHHPNIKFFTFPQDAEQLREMINPYLYDMANETNETRSLSKGEVLIKKGQEDQNVYFVVEGSFFVLDEIEGQKVILGSIKKGEIVGMMSLLTNTPRSANVIAAEDSAVTELPHDTLRASLGKQPFWVKTLFKTLCNRLMESNKKLAEITAKK